MTFNGKTILLAEDEEDLREILRDELKKYGARILEAGNGNEALAILSSESVDLIISDIRMPELGGIDLLKAVKKENEALPVMIMTAFSDHTVEEIFDCGADGIMTKPFRPKVVTASVEKHFLSLEERLSLVQELAPEKNLELQYESLEEAFQKKHLAFGKGGFCFCTENSTLTTNSIMKLDISFKQERNKIEGIGICRWRKRTTTGLVSYGIEFLNLSYSSITMLKELSAGKITFIPKCPQ